MIEHLASTHKALGSIHSTETKKKESKEKESILLAKLKRIQFLERMNVKKVCCLKSTISAIYHSARQIIDINMPISVQHIDLVYCAPEDTGSY